MGIVPGTNIAAGPKLMRGSWNAQPWGPLYDLQVEGVAKGTDLYFNKSTSKNLNLHLHESSAWIANILAVKTARAASGVRRRR
jgi:hypothetical protein